MENLEILLNNKLSTNFKFSNTKRGMKYLGNLLPRT